MLSCHYFQRFVDGAGSVRPRIACGYFHPIWIDRKIATTANYSNPLPLCEGDRATLWQPQHHRRPVRANQHRGNHLHAPAAALHGIGPAGDGRPELRRRGLAAPNRGDRRPVPGEDKVATEHAGDRALPDGSYLPTIGQMPVRLLTARIALDTEEQASTATYRLVPSLLDPTEALH